MITVVLADDEKMIRAGLKKILQENIAMPLEIIEAKNGEEALNLCKEKEPEILITDIRMPVMDGVELMKRLSESGNPSVKPAIIVLSGYDDFTYAKAAIQSGALSYILKPVDKKELIGAVNSAIMDCLQAEKISNEQQFRKIMEKGRIDDVSTLPKITVKNGLRCIVIYGNNPLLALESVMADRKYYVLEQTKKSVLIVYPFEGKEVTYDPALLEKFVVGISGPADDYSMLRTMRKQAVTAAMQAFFDVEGGAVNSLLKGGLYYYESQNHMTDFQQIDELYEKIMSKCDISSAEEIQKGIKNLFTSFEKDSKLNSEILYYLYRKVVSNLFSRYAGYTDSDMYLHIKSIMIENIFEFKNIYEWQSSITDYVVYLAALLKQNSKESPYISEAIDFVKTHFKKNINMAMVANQVSVNYTWFSEKFKEHTGVNFNEYLKRLRIDEAKSLLEKGCYKVYEVSERSGFSDVKYFMKIFREVTGMSPTEWSNKHQFISKSRSE